MMRTSLCMAAIALLCSTSAIAQTSGGYGQPGSAQPGASQPGTGMTGPSTARPGSETGTMEQAPQAPEGQPPMGQPPMGQPPMEQPPMEQGTATGQSAMESRTGQGQNFAAFDLNSDGTLDRLEFARAMQVEGVAPAAGGEAGMPSRQSMRGDRAISPLNQSSVDFQRADANGDGRISQEEFSGRSPQ